MTVLLRPHHLLCILTHVGKGYSPSFTANMADVIERINDSEEIEIVDGPDDICVPLKGKKFAHCHRKKVAERDRAAAGDIGKLLAVSVDSGVRMVLDEATIRTLRRAFSAMRVRSACEGCRWNSLCTSVASMQYVGTHL